MEFETGDRFVGLSSSGHGGPAKGNEATVAAEITEPTNCLREMSECFDMRTSLSSYRRILHFCKRLQPAVFPSPPLLEQ